MRAAIYNPYWDTLGGGERYSISVALALLAKGYTVDVEWKDEKLRSQLEKRFGIDLTNIDFVDDVKRGDGYDVCFWLSDGSVPTLKSRKNFLHFQFPFKGVDGNTLINKMKFFRINKVICNSYFTKEVVDREYGVNSIVIYPPVDVKKMKPLKKENIIMYIGRFSELTQAKRQDILIRTFKKLYDSGLKDWRLILAGGIEVGAKEYLQKLKNMAAGYPIKFLESPDFKVLRDTLGGSKIFWSAAGYGVDEKKNPKLVEHFGISVVEAMASGSLPIVFNGGGYKEIIKEGETGFLWNTLGGLVKKTRKVIENEKLLKTLSRKARQESQKFSYERFEKEFQELL